MLSKYFDLSDFTQSDTAARMGRVVSVPAELLGNGRLLANQLLDEIHAWVSDIYVTSGYRPDWLNTAIGGAPGSAHMEFRAADIKSRSLEPLELARRIRAMHLPMLDKLILEFNAWCHVQVARPGEEPRQECLTAVKRGGATIYLPDLVENAT